MTHVELSIDSWEPNAFIDDPLIALHATLVIDGLPLHLEAWEVYTNDEGLQQAKEPYAEDFGTLHDAVHGEGPFRTLNINGRDYIIVATPYCD